MKTVDLVVDGNSLYARAFWATSRDTISEELVLRSCLLSIFSLLNPDSERVGQLIDRVAFCWDGDHQRDKGARQQKPAAYFTIRQRLMDLVEDILGAANVLPKAHEADDAIGTIVYRNCAKVDKIIVVSGDKDLMQLHGQNVHYYSLNDQFLCSSAFICRKFHVKRPSQIAIYLAIKGDSVDNIKGIKGWGDKKVKKLFEQVTDTVTFDVALEMITDQIPPALQNDFWSSLERTLLDTEVPDIADPAPLKLAPLRVVDDLDLMGVTDSYRRLLAAYAEPEDEAEDA